VWEGRRWSRGRGRFQAKQEGTAVELQTGAGAPVQVAVHRDQFRAALKVPEYPVERRVTELGPGAADDDHVRCRVVVDDRDSGQILPDPAAVE
jgi:hypothetical protein